MFAFLADRDESRPSKPEQIGWCANLTAEMREKAIMDEWQRLVCRSSMPSQHPTLCLKVKGTKTAHVLELVDGDVRKADLPFDFLDNVWFRFTLSDMEINGLTDEDWILARLADMHNLLVESKVCSLPIYRSM